MQWIWVQATSKWSVAPPAKIPYYELKALVVKNSVLYDFSFGKVSPAKQLKLYQEGFVNPRHFSKTEVVQNTVLNH